MAEANINLISKRPDHNYDINNFRDQLFDQFFSFVKDQKQKKTINQFRQESIYALECEGYSHSYVRSCNLAYDHFIKIIGPDSYIDQISSKDCEICFSIIKRNVPSGYQNYFRNLRRMFNKAVEWGYISANPMIKIKLPGQQEVKPQAITINQLNAALPYIKNPIVRSMIVVLYYTGVRVNELVNLPWNNVDFEENTILIGSKNYRTKNKKSRLLPVSKVVLEVLHSIKPDPKEIKEQNFVFCKSGGFPFSVSYISKSFKKACRAAKLPEEIHAHSLRHSFCTNLVKNNVPIYTVSKLAGHSSVQVTEKFYSHLDLEDLRKGIQKLDELQ